MLRDAATLILYRNEPDGLRVLMGMRNAQHQFMPNLMVFPGGRVDAEDCTAPLASPLPPAAMQRLLRGATPALAAGLCHAAARELEEETGLTLGHPPDLSGLDYLCRAETPEGRPIRYNARFFMGEAALVQGELGGSGELESLDWYAAEQLLQWPVPPVTRLVLQRLQEWLAHDAAGRAARKTLIYRYPDWVEE